MNRLIPDLAFMLGVATRPRQHPTQLAYVNGFAYGVGLNMLGLLIPLYALDQGYDLRNLGIIVAAPAFFMVLLRLPGGAISDRFGEKVVLWFSFGALTLSSLIAVTSGSLIALIVAQLFNGASRSVYWSAGQSYASRSAEGEAGRVLGRLLSFESSGGILGGIVIGFVAQFVGYPIAFAIAAVVNGSGLLVTGLLPKLQRKDQIRDFWSMLKPAAKMLVQRRLAFAYVVAFSAAAYAGLIGGLFLAFFKEVGYEEGVVGVIRSLNSAGLAAIAYVFGTILSRFGPRTTGALGITLTGALSLVVIHTSDFAILSIGLMTAAGATFGSLRALYPSLAAQNSPPHMRGVALSAVSLYWAFAMLISPLAFGFIAEATSITEALTIFGVLSVAVGVLSPVVWFWSQRGTGDAGID